MRGMRFDDDGASGGERRSGVSATDGEGKGEIAGSKDSNRAERAQLLFHPQPLEALDKLADRSRLGRSGEPRGEAWPSGGRFESANLGRRSV